MPFWFFSHDWSLTQNTLLSAFIVATSLTPMCEQLWNTTLTGKDWQNMGISLWLWAASNKKKKDDLRKMGRNQTEITKKTKDHKTFQTVGRIACVAWQFCWAGRTSGEAVKFVRETWENERRSRKKNKNRLPGFMAFSTAAPFNSFWHPVDNLFGFSFPSQSEIKCWQPKHDTKACDIM